MKGKRTYLIVLGLVAIVAAVVVVLRLRAESPEVLQARADKSFAEEDFDAALLDYRKVLGKQPGNVHALQRAGRIWMERGATLRALPFLIEARKHAPENAELGLEWAEAYLALGDPGAVRTELLKILDRDPTNHDALVLLANTSQGAEAVEETRSRLQKLDPARDATYHLAEGILANIEDNRDQVRASLQRALELEDTFVEAHLALASYHAKEGNEAESLAAFQRASELAGPRSTAHLRYAQALASAGKNEEAQQLLRKVNEEAKDYLPAYRVLAELQATGNEHDEALKSLGAVFRIDPVNLNARSVQARIFVAKGEPEKAVEAYEKLAEAYPDLPRIRFDLATYALRSNNTEKARQSLQAVLAKAPPSSKIHADATVFLAELDLRGGTPAEAAARLAQLVEDRPELDRVPYLLARAYEADGRIEDAVELFRGQIEKYPEQAAPHVALARLLRIQKRDDEALQELERAQELAPEDQTIAFQVIDLDLQREDFASAHARADRLLAKDDQNWGAWFLKGRVLSAEENWDEAESALLKALEIKPGSLSVYDQLVGNYLRRGETTEAVERLKALTAEGTPETRHRMLLAILHERLKDYPAAIEVYEAIIEDDPGFVPALNNLAYIHSNYVVDLPKAESLVRRARQTAPEDPAVADTLGWTLVQLDDPTKLQEGLALLQEAATALDNAEIQYHLGVASLKSGQQEQARQALQRAVTADLGADPPAWKPKAQELFDQITGSGMSLDGLGIADLEERRKTNPHNAAIPVRLGQLYQEQGEDPKAVAAYRAALELDQTQPEALKALARLLKKSEPEQARQFAARARRAHPDDPEASALDGQWVLRENPGAAALAYRLMQPAAANSSDPALLADFATAAYTTGHLEEARAAMGNIPADAPQHPEAQTFLTLTAPAGDDPGPLETAAREELARNPDSLPARMIEATRLTRQNDPAAAQIYQDLRQQHPAFTPATLALAKLYAQDPARLDEAETLALEARQQAGPSPEIQQVLEQINAAREAEESNSKPTPD